MCETGSEKGVFSNVAELGVGTGVTGSFHPHGTAQGSLGVPQPCLGLVGCTRAQHPWGWVCEGQRARVGVRRAGGARGVECARDSTCGCARWAGGAVLRVSGCCWAPGLPGLWGSR